MGRKIINASLWSWRSLISLYTRAMTLVFALFCVATGQLIKTPPANGLIKSRALFESTSTPLKNLKLYLCATMYPVYGMSSVPQIVKKDSTYSDSSGYFLLPDTVTTCNYYISTPSVTTNQKNAFYLSTTTYCPKGKDSVITLRMREQIHTDVKNIFSEQVAVKSHYSIQGGMVTVKVPVSTNDIKGASVINVNGQTVAQLQPLTNGDIRWNTSLFAKGIYFLNIENDNGHLNIKIILK
jgi:hypothetical protein